MKTVRFAFIGGGEFDLEIRRFGEEFGGGFGEKSESDSAEVGDELIAVPHQFNSIIFAGVAIQQLVGQRIFFFARPAQVANPDVAVANRVPVILE
jgi:hypothetical protein